MDWPFGFVELFPRQFLNKAFYIDGFKWMQDAGTGILFVLDEIYLLRERTVWHAPQGPFPMKTLPLSIVHFISNILENPSLNEMEKGLFHLQRSRNCQGPFCTTHVDILLSFYFCKSELSIRKSLFRRPCEDMTNFAD